jgi:hypothetical protein
MDWMSGLTRRHEGMAHEQGPPVRIDKICVVTGQLADERDLQQVAVLTGSAETVQFWVCKDNEIVRILKKMLK